MKISEHVTNLFGQPVSRTVVAKTLQLKERYLHPENSANLPRPKIGLNRQKKLEILRFRDRNSEMSQHAFISLVLGTLFAPDEEICHPSTIRRVLDQREEILDMDKETQEFSV